MTGLSRLPSDGCRAISGAARNGEKLMNAVEPNLLPGVRGLYALASRAPGTYKGGPAGAVCGVLHQPGLLRARRLGE